MLPCCAALPPVGDAQAMLSLLKKAAPSSTCNLQVLLSFKAISHMQALLCWTQVRAMCGVQTWLCLQAGAALLLAGNHAILLCLRAGPLALTPSLVLVGYCCPPQPGYVQTLTAVQACRRDLV